MALESRPAAAKTHGQRRREFCRRPRSALARWVRERRYRGRSGGGHDRVAASGLVQRARCFSDTPPEGGASGRPAPVDNPTTWLHAVWRFKPGQHHRTAGGSGHRTDLGVFANVSGRTSALPLERGRSARAAVSKSRRGRPQKRYQHFGSWHRELTSHPQRDDRQSFT